MVIFNSYVKLPEGNQSKRYRTTFFVGSVLILENLESHLEHLCATWVLPNMASVSVHSSISWTAAISLGEVGFWVVFVTWDVFFSMENVERNVEKVDQSKVRSIQN